MKKIKIYFDYSFARVHVKVDKMVLSFNDFMDKNE
jgi:hypothetical protein